MHKSCKWFKTSQGWKQDFWISNHDRKCLLKLNKFILQGSCSGQRDYNYPIFIPSENCFVNADYDSFGWIFEHTAVVPQCFCGSCVKVWFCIDHSDAWKSHFHPCLKLVHQDFNIPCMLFKYWNLVQFCSSGFPLILTFSCGLTFEMFVYLKEVK